MTATTNPLPPAAASVMAQVSHENFPVASRLLGARTRRHLLAIYGYARLVDDIGDVAPGDRSALLDWAERELDLVYGAGPEHPLMRALVPTVRECGLPREPLQRLIAANRQDQVVGRYRDMDELLAYCQLAAAPVGELVLHVFGRATPDRIRLSDRICAGLQLTEHLQDVVEDRARDRVYLPQEDMARFGCTDADLAARTPSPAFRAVMAFEVERARGLLAEGAPLLRRLPLRPALAVAGFIGGGRSALDALERGGYDVLGSKPRAGRAALLVRWLRTAGARA